MRDFVNKIIKLRITDLKFLFNHLLIGDVNIYTKNSNRLIFKVNGYSVYNHGDEIGLALDCGPGMMLSDAIRLAKVLEPYNLMWMEDMLTGDYRPYVNADDYLELTRSTTVPIHTGEQIYLRQNFRELIEKSAIRIIGPDVADVGGLAELKWIAEFADVHCGPRI